jgi:hypothetical protein
MEENLKIYADLKNILTCPNRAVTMATKTKIKKKRKKLQKQIISFELLQPSLLKDILWCETDSEISTLLWGPNAANQLNYHLSDPIKGYSRADDTEKIIRPSKTTPSFLTTLSSESLEIPDSELDEKLAWNNLLIRRRLAVVVPDSISSEIDEDDFFGGTFKYTSQSTFPSRTSTSEHHKGSNITKKTRKSTFRKADGSLNIKALFGVDSIRDTENLIDSDEDDFVDEASQINKIRRLLLGLFD